MKTRSRRVLLHGAILALGILSITPRPGQTAPLLEQTTFGTAADEFGNGIAADATGVYFSGFRASPSEALVGKYPLSLGPVPTWSRTWPGAPSQVETSWGIALGGSAVVTVGSSYVQTSDIVGDKESKGITVRFNADGSPGGGVGGAVLARQTPAPPGAFPFGGGEELTGVATMFQAGQTHIYSGGVGERVGFTNQFGTFLTKLDAAGTILWTKSDFTPTVVPTYPAVAATPDAVYLATRNDTSGTHPYLKKFDPEGNLLWPKTSLVTGEYLGVATMGDRIVAVGQAGVGSPNTAFLLESWDSAGNPLWSRTYDRSLTEDLLNDVAIRDGRVYAVGSTQGVAADGTDGILLELDLLTGNLLDSTLWGGLADDAFSGVAIADATLFASGTTKSFGAGGSDIAIVSFALPGATVPEPATLALMALGVPALACVRRWFR